jgi:hypothetical protein
MIFKCDLNIFPLTNAGPDPGRYIVSARAWFPSTNQDERGFHLDTLPIEIQVLPPTNRPPIRTNAVSNPPAAAPIPLPEHPRPLAPLRNSVAKDLDHAADLSAPAPQETEPQRHLLYGALLVSILLLGASLWFWLRRKRS